jgi:hypothetical protein
VSASKISALHVFFSAVVFVYFLHIRFPSTSALDSLSIALPASPFTFARLLREGFAQIADPRIDRTKLHLLPDPLMIALCTILCGGDAYEHKPDWARLQGEE